VNRFRVNEPNVVFESFEEEIVLVNLDTGNYYSLRGTGPEIWRALADRLTPQEAAERLQSRFIGDTCTIVEAVSRLADRLVCEALLVEAPDAEPRECDPGPAVAKTPFTEPEIENYHDMQDLLMLDPIHDVDPKGWPLAKPEDLARTTDATSPEMANRDA
jgi:hypothetical protein